MSFFRRADSDTESSSGSSSEEELLSDVEEAAEPKTSNVKKSRFARSSGEESSDEDEDSDEDQDLDSDDGQKKPAAAKVSRFARGAGGDSSDSDESEDEGRKVVKSAKSKRADELDGANKRVENAAKIDDWVTVNSEFDRMTRLVQSAPSNVLAVVSIPSVYIRLLTSLEENITEASSKKKKLNATHSRALNGIKQKLKKNQREYEALIAKYKEDPEEYERQVEGVPSAATAAPSAKKGRKKVLDELAAADGQEEDFTTVGKGGKALSLTPDTVLKTLQSVLEARGKKATDRAEQIKILEKLFQISPTPYSRIRVLLALISSLFDYNTSAHNYLPLDQWEGARLRLEELLSILKSEPRYVVKEDTEEYDELEERAPEANSPKPLLVRGSVLSLIERLDDEFTRSLKDIDPHAVEYVERLKDESKVYATLAASAVYFENTQSSESLNRVILRRLDHIYGKPDVVITALESSLPTLESSVWPSPASQEPGEGNLVRALCVVLYKPTVDPRLRSKAVLFHVYHHALHNEYYKARDMLLMSHVYQTAHNMDVDTQILYNRTIAQLGLSAFRNGLFDETESLLRELYANPTLVRERLAQGTQRRNPDFAVSPEQEKLERARQLPFHQHINLELLECAYLVSSMLIEIPQIALEEYDLERKRDVRSRMFRRQIDSFDKQTFSGPPENKREYVVQAAKALQSGEWKTCIDLIDGIKVWALMPGEKDVKALLARKIQEEGLRTYLFSHAPFYSTVSISYLAHTFDLPLADTTALVASMIWNEQLAASLDAKSEMLTLHREARSALQQMALNLADKISQALSENERTAAVKFGDADQPRDGQRDRRDLAGDTPRRGGDRRNNAGRGKARRGVGTNFATNSIGRTVRA